MPRDLERAHGTGIVLVITTADEMIHETDTGSAGLGEGVYSSEYLLYVSALFTSVLYVYHRILENPPTFGRSSVVAYKVHSIGPFTKGLNLASSKILSLSPTTRQVVCGSLLVSP